MEFSVPLYSLYFLDSNDSTVRVREFACWNDAEAETLAQTYADGLVMELLHKDRCIRQFDATALARSGGRQP
jgi:hypothetical protein